MPAQLFQYKPKKGAEFVCLNCTLPECDEGHPGCLYKSRRKHRKSTKWNWLFAKIQELEPGGLLIETMKLADVRSARAAVAWQVRSGKLPKVKTWTVKQEAETGLLHFYRNRK